MTAPGNYPAIHTGGLAVIPIEHQTLLSAGLREKERGSGSGSGPYPNWQYRGTIQITNPVSIANYQHYLSLSWKPGMNFDFSDIRFTQQDGVTICPYWIETYTSKTSAGVWIKIPSASQRQITLFYGNSRASSESSGSSVFDFFDDFPGSSVDTSKWTATGSPTVTGGTVVISSGSLVGKTNFGVDYIVRLKMKSSAFGSTGFPYFGFRTTGNGAFTWVTDPGGIFCIYTSSGGNTRVPLSSNPSINTYYTYEIARRSTTSVLFSASGFSSVQSTTNIPTDNLPITLSTAGDSAPTVTFDWVLVRKYTATEPTLVLKQYGPRPDAKIIYYPFLPSPLSELPGGTLIEELLEFTQTMTVETPIVLLGALVPFTQTMTASTPAVYKSLAAISASQTMKTKIFAKIFLNLSLVRTKSITISKSIQDTLWRADIALHQYKNLDMTVLRHCTYATTDHTGTSHTLFTGILPGNQPQLAPADETSRITGYDYAWFLTQRKVPETYLHNTAATNPATVITGLLGGDDWMSETGIEPYSIQTVAEWGDTLNTRVFDFDRTTSRSQAIQRICDYCRYVFIVKWRDIGGGILNPCAYFCHEDDIDTYLDLPAEVTFTKPDPYVDDKITWDVKGDERYNRVTVYGRESDGTSISYTAETADVTNGDEIPVEFVESSGAFTTASQVQARAKELLDYFSTEAKTYTVVLKNRVDLELLQKVRFIGWTEIPETSMRIISISYTIDDATATKKVTIQVTSETKLSQIKRMYRCSNPDPLSEAEALFDAKAAAMPGNEVGVVTAIDETSGTATVLLEDGRTVTARIV